MGLLGRAGRTEDWIGFDAGRCDWSLSLDGMRSGLGAR